MMKKKRQNFWVSSVMQVGFGTAVRDWQISDSELCRHIIIAILAQKIALKHQWISFITLADPVNYCHWSSFIYTAGKNRLLWTWPIIEPIYLSSLLLDDNMCAAQVGYMLASALHTCEPQAWGEDVTLPLQRQQKYRKPWCMRNCIFYPLFTTKSFTQSCCQGCHYCQGSVQIQSISIQWQVFLISITTHIVSYISGTSINRWVFHH